MRLDIDKLRLRLEEVVKLRGKAAGIQSRQILALLEVLVEAINDSEIGPFDE